MAVTLTPTAEQRAIIDAFRDGLNLVIQAGAGCGKTATARMIAGAAPELRGVYVAYNKAIAADAKGSFPPSVVCATAHSFAFRAVGRRFAHRLGGPRMPARETARILRITGPARVDLGGGEARLLAPQQVARLVMRTVTRFCHSAASTVLERHVPRLPGLDTPVALAALAIVVVPLAQRAWADLCSVDGQLAYTHDHYLKLWQLSGPRLDGDYVVLDEAQDANPCVAAVVEGQTHAQRILIGDACQQLYAWRGATDAMAGFHADARLTLSQSFRFGPAVADEANKWLGLLDAPLRLRGLERLRSRLAPLTEPDAVLCRTNAGAVGQLLAASAQGRRAALVGGGGDIKRLAEAAITLKAGAGTDHPELLAFRTWREVQEYVEQDEAGSDLKVFVNLIDEHGPEQVIAIVDRLVDERRADVVVSTAHKCVRPDTLVETPEGLQPIRAIPGAGVIATPRGPASYHGKFTRPNGALLEIATRRGYALTVSPEHGLTVWRDGRHVRVPAAQLEVGDWLRLRLGPTIEPAAAPRLPGPPATDARARAYMLPTRMSEEVAELLGLLVADGTVFADARGFRLVKRYQSVVDRFAWLVKELFGYDAKLGDHAGTPQAEVHASQITKWLLAIGGVAPKRKHVPAVVLASPSAMQAAFLRGLFEDGTVNRRGDTVDHVRWDNHDPALAAVVQTMLLRLGIVASRRLHHGLASLYLYSRHAARFAEVVGFVAAEKNLLLDGARFGEDRHCLIPISRQELAPLDRGMCLTDRQNARVRGYVSRTVAEKVVRTLGATACPVLVERLGWHYEPVAAIGATEGEAICVTVPDGSRFLQNGFDGWNSKGREWPKIRVADDFTEPKREPNEDGTPPAIPPADGMLAYVTVTRAQEVLDRGGLAWVDDWLYDAPSSTSAFGRDDDTGHQPQRLSYDLRFREGVRG